MGCCCVPKAPIVSESNTDLQAATAADTVLKGILHDIKNDINPMKGAAEIIANGDLTEKQRRMVSAITTSVDKLNADVRRLQSALKLE